MKIKPFILLAAILGVTQFATAQEAAAPEAPAQEAPAKKPLNPKLEKFDLDKDGILSPEEKAKMPKPKKPKGKGKPKK